MRQWVLGAAPSFRPKPANAFFSAFTSPERVRFSASLCALRVSALSLFFRLSPLDPNHRDAILPSTAFRVASIVNASDSSGMLVTNGRTSHATPVGISRVSETTSLCT